MVTVQSPTRADLRHFLITETAIAAIVNGAIMAAITWLVFSGHESIPVWGNDGLVFDLLPSSALPVFTMALILPAILHKRHSAGERLPVSDWAELGGWPRALPKGILALALVLATTWAALFIAVGATVLWFAGWNSLSLWSVVLGKTLFGALLGATAAPFIMLPALARLQHK
jgi:hypothetical protein